MANEVQTPPEQAGTADLLRGIINDIGDLFRQEIRFARTEFKSDMRLTVRAGTVLTFGVGTAVLGALLLALMLVHLIKWLSLPAGTAPEVDPGLPLWACHGIVSAVFLVVGSGVTYAGVKMFQSFNPLPDETAESVKENVEWMVNSK